jgi:hypothetical protein
MKQISSALFGRRTWIYRKNSRSETKEPTIVLADTLANESVEEGLAIVGVFSHDLADVEPSGPLCAVDEPAELDDEDADEEEYDYEEDDEEEDEAYDEEDYDDEEWEEVEDEGYDEELEEDEEYDDEYDDDDWEEDDEVDYDED